MQRNKNRIVQAVGHYRAIVESRILVTFACKQYAKTLGFERDPSSSSEIQHDITFRQPGRASRTKVGAAMSWIEDYGHTDGLFRGR